MNKAEKSLRWVVNQILDFKPTTNGECTFASPEYYKEQSEKELAEERKDD